MERFESLIESPPVPDDEGPILGRSREGRAIRGFRFGSGARELSLLAGCHADEPVGPRLLRHLVGYLSVLDPADPWLSEHRWWIVPHVNPDGRERNAVWIDEDATAFELGRYLQGAVRELPGDDVEFGFPRGHADQGARPENRAVFDWWSGSGRPFHLHVSLHGTGFGAGPWFLIEPGWIGRVDALKHRLVRLVSELGYVPHDVERHGEKGFVRIERGFCTRPDSISMSRHFLELGDPETAARFRPSSMETVRSLGGDPLTLVSEMPHFLTPGVGETLGPPDPTLARWRERIAQWRSEVARTGDPDAVTRTAAAAGITPMPILDQMKLQWELILAGLEMTRSRST